MSEIKFRQLCEVYQDSIFQDGALRYPNEPESIRILWSQQDFYTAWELFFREKTALCALWSEEDAYCACLRVEQYRDGYLLSTLETAPGAREKGHATNLVRSSIVYLKEMGVKKIYSHIHNENAPSISVHCKCGFRKILNYAVYLDGSVLHNTDTYLYEIE